eukprot:TRINITY_DN77334_c0_g1_i1.p1 TRINITY_DN77334_c0_g1~~TRINITY_DN77334_c0_g1_i1.p1  ORF type:complete len:955 (+),score=165.10 TRINITY_DN77334_c0_g1_i1:32-2896(+)
MTEREPNTKKDTKRSDADEVYLLQSLPIWEKFARGDVHLVTRQDVDDIFDVMDTEGKGYLTSQGIMTLQCIEDLSLSIQDLSEMCADADKDKSGHINAEELYHAMTEGTLAFNCVKESLGKRQHEITTTSCEREQLLEWMKYEYETNSALWSLPVSLAMLVVFAWQVVTHIDLFSAFRVHQAFREHLLTLTVFQKYKAVNIPTLNWWASNYFFPVMFRQDELWDPIPGRIAVHNQLVFGFRVQKHYYDAIPCDMLDVYTQAVNAQDGTCVHEIGEPKTASVPFPYHVSKDVLLEQYANMTRAAWIDDRVQAVEFQALYYNGNVNLFTFENIRFHHQADGLWKLRWLHESWLADPYISITYAIPDVIYLVFLLRAAYFEFKQLIPAASQGLDGIADYLGFWQFVDWGTICFGLVAFAYWAMTFKEISVDLPDALAQIPKSTLDLALKEQGYLSLQQLSEIIPVPQLLDSIDNLINVAMQVRDSHETLRAIFVINFFVLVLTFFKSFRANPRLDIVIQTIIRCSGNIAHFGIVFFSIFACYAFAGHFLIGHKVKGYSMVAGALFECWRGLVGMDVIDDLPYSGQVLAYSWTLSFQILVKIITLNMLMGIVFAAYYAVKSESGEPLTLWSQVAKTMLTATQTRRHVSLWLLIVQMEDDDYPAHPAPTVTVPSLKLAFEKDKLTRQNAQYLVKRTVEYVQSRQESLDLDLTDAIKVLGNAFNVVQKHCDVVEETMDVMKGQLTTKDVKLDEEEEAETAIVVAAGTNQSQEESEEQTPSDVFQACLSNMQDLLGVLREEQTEEFHSISNLVRKERATFEARSKMLDDGLSEFSSRLNRADRGIKRLANALGKADFGKLSGVPEVMEQDIMLTFGSKPAMLHENLQPGRLLMLEDRARTVYNEIEKLCADSDKSAEASQMLWDIQLNLRRMSRLREAESPKASNSKDGKSGRPPHKRTQR